MQPPPDPDFRGLKSARKWAKALKDFCVSQSVASINGKLPTAAGPTGKIFNIPVGVAAAPAAAAAPFHCTDGTVGGTLKIHVKYGTVNSIEPSQMVGNLDADITVTVTGKVYLDATVNSVGTITALTLATAASVPANTTTHAYQMVCSFTVASGAITVINDNLIGSQAYQKCGTQHLWGAV